MLEALPSLILPMFNAPHSLVRKRQLYTLKHQEVGDCLKVTNCQLEKERIIVVFSKLFLKLMVALEVRGLSRPTNREVEVVRKENV